MHYDEDAPYEYRPDYDGRATWSDLWATIRGWFPVRRSTYEAGLNDVRVTTAAKLNQMEARIMGDLSTAEQEQFDRGLVLVGLIRAEFASLHTQLDSAIQDKDAAVEAGVTSALGEDAAADAQRVKDLLDQLADTLPGTVPDVPVPDPGQPAEDPGTVTDPGTDPVDDGGNPPDVPVES